MITHAKTIVATSGVLAFALLGCNPKPDSRVSKLESKVEEMSERLAKLDAGLSENKQLLQKATSDLDSLFNSDYSTSTNIVLIYGFIGELNEDIRELQKRPPLKQPLVYQPVVTNTKPIARAATSVAQQGGVPSEVYRSIKAKAEKEWPGDFSMQAYEIDLQIKAYKKIHP